tara:strand:- start:49 stop:312 length:264 start_codon:yes stop_codon:yes gene_type:complete
MTFKTKLSQKYDSVQMEENREKIEDLLERVVETAAKSMIGKEGIQITNMLLLGDEISLKSFETFLDKEGISYQYKEATKSYYIDLTE